MGASPGARTSRSRPMRTRRRKPFKEAQYPKVWNALESVDTIIKQVEPEGAEATFIDSLKRHTTDEPVRQARTEFLVKLIAKKL